MALKPSRLTKSHKPWRQIADDYPELKEILLDHQDADFWSPCKLSPRADKLCPYAQIDGETTSCALLVDWWTDWSIVHLEHCFATYANNKKINWRNKMLRASGASFREIRRC